MPSSCDAQGANGYFKLNLYFLSSKESVTLGAMGLGTDKTMSLVFKKPLKMSADISLLRSERDWIIEKKLILGRERPHKRSTVKAFNGSCTGSRKHGFAHIFLPLSITANVAQL